MSGIATAIVGGAIIGGVAANMAADTSAGAMESAANTQAGAANYAANLQHEEWLKTQENMKPWLEAGTSSINQLATGLQPGGKFSQFRMNPLISDPSYQWRRQEGVNALAASGAAAGNYGSGNLGVALQNYGQNLASTEYQNEYARQYGEWLNSYNMLAGISGTGQTTATSLGQLGFNTAGAMGDARMGGANALAAGQIGSAQAQSQSIMNWGRQIQGLTGMGANYLMEQNKLNQNPYGTQNNVPIDPGYETNAFAQYGWD